MYNYIFHYESKSNKDGINAMVCNNRFRTLSYKYINIFPMKFIF